MWLRGMSREGMLWGRVRGEEDILLLRGLIVRGARVVGFIIIWRPGLGGGGWGEGVWDEIDRALGEMEL